MIGDLGTITFLSRKLILFLFTEFGTFFFSVTEGLGKCRLAKIGIYAHLSQRSKDNVIIIYLTLKMIQCILSKVRVIHCPQYTYRLHRTFSERISFSPRHFRLLPHPEGQSSQRPAEKVTIYHTPHDDDDLLDFLCSPKFSQVLTLTQKTARASTQERLNQPPRRQLSVRPIYDVAITKI